MQSKEAMKKLADNYETLVFVSKRYLSSMSRLKNLLRAYLKLLPVEKLQIWRRRQDVWCWKEVEA